MKLLITGGSGFLGRRIYEYYKSQYECILPTHQELDICDQTSCIKLIEQQVPDYVIHTAAISDMGACERNPELSYQINVSGTVNLARACAAVSARLIFASSDQVYNGSAAAVPNRETDLCQPINTYSRQKLEAEQRLFELLPDAIALRLTWMYDLPTDQLSVKENFLTRLLSAVGTGQASSWSDQEYRGITYVRDVISNLEPALTIPGGIYNFGSDSDQTTFALARNVVSLIRKGQEPGDLILQRQTDGLSNLAMDQTKLNQQSICFPDNLAGIRRCLTDHGYIV